MDRHVHHTLTTFVIKQEKQLMMRLAEDYRYIGSGALARALSIFTLSKVSFLDFLRNALLFGYFWDHPNDTFEKMMLLSFYTFKKHTFESICIAIVDCICFRKKL